MMAIVMEQTKYHVHKIILGVVPKKSVYFAKLFRSENAKEMKEKTSDISLEQKHRLFSKPLSDKQHSHIVNIDPFLQY